MSSEPRVILHVGTQVIDSTNLEVAQACCGVFLNDQDEIMVLDKGGTVEELQTSPYADQLDPCLVYLDEAHTRGIDLRLPAHYQAAVTPGANVTKDRLTQACMRMRKLGKGQSVIFFISKHIEQEIRQSCGHEDKSPEIITVSNVVSWAITETCKDFRRAVPTWLNQGLRFTKRQPIWHHLTDQDDKNLPSRFNGISPRYAAVFQDRCQQFELTEMHHASLDEEQERELAPEAEQEYQMEELPKVKPAENSIHPGLDKFIVEGILPKDPDATIDVSEFPSAILVTRDFAVTVDRSFGPELF
ncbi:hypothetical protein BU24DRAFT_436272 [Aaosphaeria arxii CBS 175.79]|uniref:ubiquitinyl hydrolase 1 n=1 Tax=Aaosphaeria arxii CBS 175.79 TaxID=1450172 RepID=A0A6A5XDC9_9PLEO|nr:uncharacterized protein BU24DRAFT_436272 [Aaosphaeria arxii CBS 175.79]KAF2010911.1 hypothetical protein BU24DRAFT_436272 [Aaosphaeria arxii CBS 175.79]